MITTEQRRDQFKCKKFSSKIICGETNKQTNKDTKLDIMKKKTRMQFGIKKVESQSV